MKTKKYKIVAKDNHLAVHSVGFHGESGRVKAQAVCDSGEAGKYWSDKEQAAKGFRVIEY